MNEDAGDSEAAILCKWMEYHGFEGRPDGKEATNWGVVQNCSNYMTSPFLRSLYTMID